jgi:hypothetical protein
MLEVARSVPVVMLEAFKDVMVVFVARRLPALMLEVARSVPVVISDELKVIA